jgi:hypothetical protein
MISCQWTLKLPILRRDRLSIVETVSCLPSVSSALTIPLEGGWEELYVFGTGNMIPESLYALLKNADSWSLTMRSLSYSGSAAAALTSDQSGPTALRSGNIASMEIGDAPYPSIPLQAAANDDTYTGSSRTGYVQAKLTESNYKSIA